MRIKNTTMKRKPKTIDDITAKFIVKTLPNIEVDSYFKAINRMVHLMCDNTATLLVPQWLGHHRHIFIIMNPKQYTALYITVWINYPDPGVYNTVSINATAAHQD